MGNNIVLYQFSGELTDVHGNDPSPPLSTGDHFTGFFAYDFNVHPQDELPDNPQSGIYGGKKGFLFYVIAFDTAVLFSQAGYFTIRCGQAQPEQNGYGITSAAYQERLIGLSGYPLSKLYHIEDIGISLVKSPQSSDTDALPEVLDIKSISSGSIVFHSLPDGQDYFGVQGIITEITASPFPHHRMSAREQLGLGLMRLLLQNNNLDVITFDNNKLSPPTNLTIE